MRSRRALHILTVLSTPTAIGARIDDLQALKQRFPDLGTVVPPWRSPYLGGQNFTYCCLKAVDTFLRDNSSAAVSVEQPFSAQFPCGATYDGDSAGVSSVTVSYIWCHQECGGWQGSQSQKLNQLLQPFVGFILPAVIFCLNIPRRSKLSLPPFVFPEAIDRPITFLWAIFCALTAGFIVAVDTIIWLFVVFALSGPMLLSGIYEAWIDKKVIDFIDHSIEDYSLPLSLRARILFAVLVGNLDIGTAWEPTIQLADFIDPPAISEHGVEKLGEGQRLQNVSHVKSRLKSMLSCQYSFGTLIGAPVMFYIGSFVYAIIEINTTLGDSDSAFAVGFGMWWMAIPHISIISGCLLAGNNPNTLEGIAPQVHQEVQQPEAVGKWDKFQRALDGLAQTRYRPFYDAVYKPAWMWKRGSSKQGWLLKLCANYQGRYLHDDHFHVNAKLDSLKEKLSVTLEKWMTISSLTFLLFFVPCMLGFLETYWTPQVGLSCRSMTFLMYACAQSLLLLTWIWFYSLDRVGGGDKPRGRHFLRAFLLLLLALGLGAAIFSAIGGTLMQLMGVYRNCLCKINIDSWMNRKNESNLLLSTNNKIDIAQAELHWRSMGIAAAVFLGVTCYIGWWYQRRLRYIFKGLVERLDTRLPSLPNNPPGYTIPSRDL
jgi:hypothetical protein